VQATFQSPVSVNGVGLAHGPRNTGLESPLNRQTGMSALRSPPAQGTVWPVWTWLLAAGNSAALARRLAVR
jgi:hypothetical protein